MDVEFFYIKLKSKGDPLSLILHREIKLLEQAYTLHENVKDRPFRKLVDIDKRQYGSKPRKGTVNLLF